MARKSPLKLVDGAKAAIADIQLAKAISATAAAKRDHKRVMAAAIESESRLEAMLAIQGEPMRQEFIRYCGSKSSQVAVVVPATDWHVEETIFSKAVNGKNHYNLREAEYRIKRFFSKILELIEWQNHLAVVHEIWMPLLGDLMTGYIHEELMETNSLSPTEASVFLRDMLCSGIDLLLRETNLPIYIPTCVGNHGRTTQKMRIKTSCRNSYEWLLYKTLEKMYSGNERVHFFVGEGYHNTQVVAGRKVRFHHGDGLRYNGGIGGITIPVNKSISAWDRLSPVDFDIFGHWHQFLAHYPKWVSCGSLMGYSEFSLSIKAEFQHPSQTFIVIDRRYGMTMATPIFVTKPFRS